MARDRLGRAAMIGVILTTLVGCQGAGSRRMLRTELFFGLRTNAGTEVTDEQWDAFVREVVTPRFPEGLTVVDATGQWQDGDVIVSEPSRVLVLLRPAGRDREADAEIEQVRAIYKQRFDQDSVLRTDSKVRASF